MKLTLLAFLLSINVSFAQIKEYNKDVALYRAKTFLMKEILGSTNDVLKFYIDPLVASKSGEITTLVYKCESKNKTGLLIGFTETKWTTGGVTYSEYAFRNLSANDAVDFCEKIEIALKIHSDFIDKDPNNNNIYFTYEDVNIIIYKENMGTKMRVYWNNFDCEWELSSFNKTLKRLKKELNKP